MASLWEQVKQLEGRTLRTKYGKAFQVASVDDRYVTVIPDQTGTPRRIRRIEMESAYDLHLPLENLTAKRLVEERVTAFNPVYLVSMLKAIAGASESEPAPKPAARTRQDDPEVFISQLERLAQLRQNGTLSQSEFEQARYKLLKITE